MKQPSRRSWSKVAVPHELSDLLHMIARNKGYTRENMHFFVYHLLKGMYPDEVEKLTDFLETRWLEEPPQEE